VSRKTEKAVIVDFIEDGEEEFQNVHPADAGRKMTLLFRFRSFRSSQA
jgi:hypothetical protein